MSARAADRARELVNIGRYEEALAILTPAIAHDPDAGELRCLLAQAGLESGRLTLALHAAEAAIEIDPEREWPHRLRALVLERLGRHHAAIASLKTAIACHPDEARSWYSMARLEKRLGNVDAAKAAARHAVMVDPDSTPAWTILGFALQDELESALEAHATALRLSPDSAWALNDMAWTCIQLERYDEAHDLLQRALRIAPGWLTSIFNYAMVTGFREGLAAAQRAWKRAYEFGLAETDQLIRRSPSEGNAYSRRSGYLQGLGRHREALESARKGVELAPESSTALHYYSWTAMQLGDWSAASEAMLKAHKNDPENPVYLIENAEIAYFAGDLAEERRWAERALTETPNNTFNIKASVQIALSLGEYSEAVFALEELFRYEPLNCCHRSLHAYCLLQGGRRQEAERSLHLAAARKPCSCHFRRQAVSALTKHTAVRA